MNIKKAVLQIGCALTVAALSLSVGGCGGAIATSKAPDRSFTDPRNGQEYGSVTIGGVSWMSGNLNYETGTSWCYDNKDALCMGYGRLYDWETAKSACPQGWHLPSREEWSNLIETAGGANVAGTKLKAKAIWKGSGKGTDNYGFAALPGGDRSVFERDPRSISAGFFNLGNLGRWWSSTEAGEGKAYGRYILADKEDGEYAYRVITGLSVRCVQD